MFSTALNLSVHAAPPNPYPYPDILIRQNIPAAINLLQRTIAEHETPLANFHLATLLAFHAPHHKPSNITLAIHLFETCIAECNHIPSMLNLAYILQSPSSPTLQPDIPRAAALYQRAIDERHTDSFPHICLAKLLTTGPAKFRDAPRAVRLYQTCIDQFNDYLSMRLLANVLAVGARGVPRDASRAETLYATCMEDVCDMQAAIQLIRLLLSDPARDADSVEKAVAIWGSHVGNVGFNSIVISNLALEIADGARERCGDIPLAVRLLELTIAATESPDAKFTLAKILSARPRDTDVEERAMRLFESYAEETGDWALVGSLARWELAVGTPFVEKDVRLAARLCELCVARWEHADARMALAEILLSDSRSGGRDVDRAEGLCRHIVEEDSDCFLVIQLADQLISGIAFVQRNVQLAIRLYEFCIQKRSNPLAMIQLAKFLASDREDGERDVSRIFHLCEMSVEDDGFPCDALCSLAAQLVAGSPHVEKDGQLAMRLYELAMEKKDCTFAMLDIVKLLLRGTCVAEWDVERVVRLCERCVDEHTDSCFEVGELAKELSRGTKNVEKSVPLAIRIYEIMVRKGHLQYLISMAELAVMGKPAAEWDVERVVQLCVRYLDDPTSNSLEVVDLADDLRHEKGFEERGISLAIRLYEECIERRKCAEAMVSLAKSLLKDRRGTEGNFDRVVKLCERHIVESDNCEEVVRFAELVTDGDRGFEKDVPLAVRLLEMCVEKLGDTDAKLLLVEVMLSDQNSDVKLAMRLYEQSVLQDIYGDGVLDIARKVASGTSGVQKNVSLSVRMYQLCIDKQNNATAMIRLCQMFISGASDIERDVYRALQLCEKHIDASDNCERVLRLAERVRDGTYGFQKDEAVAVKMYELCVEKRKDTCAMLCLLEIRTQTGDESSVMRLCDDYINTGSNCDAILKIAKWLVKGPVEMRNIGLAIRLCERFVEQMDRDAASTLVLILARCSERDVGRIEGLCRRCVEWGECGVVLRFAKKLIWRWGVPKDLSLARRVCEMCIDLRKDPGAKLLLAEILVLQNGCDQHILSLCSAQVLSDASPYTYQVICLARNAFTKHKVQLAVDLCGIVLKVCKDGRCLALLAEIMIAGDDGGVQKDFEYALSLCKRAIEADGEYAIQGLVDKVSEGTGSEGRRLARRILEVCKDDESRMQLARILVEDGDYEDAFHLCKLCMTDSYDLVVSFAQWVAFEGHDIAFAIRVCELCVEDGSRSGMVLLAEILVSGRVPRDVERCIMLCKRAVMEHIHTNYILNIARRARNGNEMDKDMDLAIRLCEICIERNCQNGMLLLAEIVVCGRGVKRDIERCLQLCGRFLREGGFARARRDILCFSGRVLEGDGVEKDVELAKRIYGMCVEMKMMKGDWELVAEIADDAGVKEDSAAFWRRAADCSTTSSSSSYSSSVSSFFLSTEGNDSDADSGSVASV